MATRLSDLIDRLSRLVQNQALGLGLAPVQLEALRFLEQVNGFSSTPGALTLWLGVTKGTVSQTLAVLERRGLVSKRASARDGRQVMLDLTPVGRAVLAADPLRSIDRYAETAPQLADDLTRLVAGLLAARGGVAFGLCRTCRHFRTADGASHCALLDLPLRDAEPDRLCIEHAA